MIKTNGAKDCSGTGVLAPQADNKNETMMMRERRDDFIYYDNSKSFQNI